MISAARQRNRARKFDAVLWGATGFTGQLVAEYLAQHPDRSKGLRWALGGRSASKLEAVRDDLARINSDCAELPIVLGDSRDAASMADLAASTEVVCTAVGP